MFNMVTLNYPSKRCSKKDIIILFRCITAYYVTIKKTIFSQTPLSVNLNYVKTYVFYLTLGSKLSGAFWGEFGLAIFGLDAAE